MIEALRTDFSVRQICEILGFNRSNLYYRPKQAPCEAGCTATGNSGHSLRQDCGIISIYLKGVSDGETQTKKLHSRV